MRRIPEPVVWVVAAVAAFAASLGLIGADALWLVPLGGQIAHGRLPGSIPFASAPTSGWHDVPAGAELVFWALYHTFGGLRGLAIGQAAAAAAGFGALAAGLRREAPAGAVLLVSLLVLAGATPSVFVIDASLFSLALFPVLLALLEAEAREPSRRLWLSVPLLALWGNLHGEVLAGWGLLACYLVLERGRREPRLAALVLAGATAALFANPELWHTPRYYWSVLGSAAARQGEGLWAPLGTGGLDIALVVIAAILVCLSFARGVGVRLWEAVALTGLAAATVHVSRTGACFLFVAAFPAARGLRLGQPKPRLLAFAAVLIGIGAVAGLVKGPADPGSTRLARIAARSGRPVLAEAVLGQQVALAGGRVWVDNPIDAFRPADQRLYLDWLDGRPGGAAAVQHAAYVLVRPRSSAGRLAARDPRLALVAAAPGAALYRVRASR